MGWDQSTGRQSVMSFLLDLMEIDPNQLLLEALQAKMAEQGLTYEVLSEAGREEGDGLYGSFTPEVVKLSDGRVFVEERTESVRGDDWGCDGFSFVEAGKPFTFTDTDVIYGRDGEDERTVEKKQVAREVSADDLLPPEGYDPSVGC